MPLGSMYMNRQPLAANRGTHNRTTAVRVALAATLVLAGIGVAVVATSGESCAEWKSRHAHAIALMWTGAGTDAERAAVEAQMPEGCDAR